MANCITEITKRLHENRVVESKKSRRFTEGVSYRATGNTAKIFDLSLEDGGFDDDSREMIEDHCKKLGFDPRDTEYVDDTNINDEEELAEEFGGEWSPSKVKSITYQEGGMWSISSFVSTDGYVAVIATNRDAYQFIMISKKRSSAAKKSSHRKVGGVTINSKSMIAIKSGTLGKKYELDKGYTLEDFIKDMESAGCVEDKKNGWWENPKNDYMFEYAVEDDGTPTLYIEK